MRRSLGVLLSFMSVGTPAAQAAGSTSSYNWNLSSSPIDWFSEANARLDRKISNHWSLGAAFYDIDRSIKTVAINDFALGGFIDFAFSAQAMNDSWFIDIGAYYGHLSATMTDPSTGQPVKFAGIEWTGRATLGYQWYFGRWNIAAALGLETNSLGGAAIKNASGTTVGNVPIIRSHGLTEITLGVGF